eukprot:CAMPEP_0181345302 /NCGR_PEP_ID=MMETSP1101-20121128/32675_1 /TAXON_ID=46948 /ORGANISM="Rhodomonas abbreviata, Strain Caron Lab Isolate" /LENGTH=229 /DNA_ID=CAMNT_0023457245 /DNA_START=211 /DNA_END=897 /DNA_ORIENTATION=+
MLRSLYCGKEKFPTISYEVTVSHDGRILAVTPGHAGTRNDKTIVRHDAFVMAVKDGKYGHVKFHLYDASGNIITESGCYLICDGGYHKWRALMCPFQDTSVKDEVNWSGKLESSRKDVECVFGRLKGRFRILKIPSLFWYQHEIDNVFFTCCCLHNILLEGDGYSADWEAEMDWGGDDGDFDWQEVGSRLTFATQSLHLTADFDASGVGRVPGTVLAATGDDTVEHETE